MEAFLSEYLGGAKTNEHMQNQNDTTRIPVYAL